MTNKNEALNLAREMLIKNREYIQLYERPSYLVLYDKAIARVEEALAEQPAQPIKQGWDVDTLLNKPKQPAQQQEPNK